MFEKPDLVPSAWVRCAWNRSELNQKTIEYSLKRASDRISGTGTLSVEENEQGLLRITVVGSDNPPKNFHLSQAEADALQKGFKSGFICFL